MSTRVFVSKEMGTRIIKLLLVPYASYTGMSCDTTVIGPVTTLINALYLIDMVQAHSLSSCFFNFAHTIPAKKELINTNWVLLDYCSTEIYFMNPSILSDIKDWYPNTAICVFTNGVHIYYNQSDTRDLLSLKKSTTYIPLPISWHSLMSPFSSELPWILATNLPCSSKLARIPSSSFIDATKDCNILTLLPLMNLILSLTLNTYVVPSNKTINSFIDPKLNKWMLPKLYNALLD